MKILTHVDLGKSFESLKKTLIEVETEVRKDQPTVLDTGIKYANAYGRLSAAVLCHIAGNTDTSYHFLDEARKEAENNPLHDALNWKDPDDLPDIFHVAGMKED